MSDEAKVRQRGKKLSPWTILNIMHRASGGERTADLAQEFGINRATINRWLLRWGEEVELVDQLRAGRLALRATVQMARKEHAS